MKISALIILLLFSLNLFAEINPYYKEVMQRGYEIHNDSVIFPDGSSCSIEDFNDGKCGKEWMTENYCIPEGEPVWDEDRCCKGLSPYLESGVDGQATCEKEGKDDWFSSSTVIYFFLGVLIPLGLFVILAYNVKKKLPKKE